MPTMAIGGCGAAGGGNSLQHAGSKLVHRASAVDCCIAPLRHELRVDAPTSAYCFSDENRALDDEHTFVVTRTATPQEASQILNS